MQPLEDPPSLIADAPGLQIWHKLDRTFKRPIALAYLCITPRCAYDSARTAALTHLVLKLLQDDVNETAYLADVAGLGYDVSRLFDLSYIYECAAVRLQGPYVHTHMCAHMMSQCPLHYTLDLTCDS